ncbi:U3 small nucleolar RNA-associated protein 13 [Monosporozyma servazzii]
MDLKTSYKNTELDPIYAGSGAIATISEDGSILATPILDEINVVQLKPTQKKLVTISNDDEQEITALKLTPDGKYLCYVSQAQLLKIAEVSTGKIVRSMKISSPAYIMDSELTSTLVAIGGTDGSIIVVDIENGYITHSFKGHGGTISSLKFHGELNSNTWLLCSGDTNGMIKIWDLVKRRCIHTVQEHNSAVRGLDIRAKADDSDLLQMISGGRDDIINFWELNTKKKCTLLKTIPAHQQVEACGFVTINDSTDIIYTAGGDAVLQFISLDKGSVVMKSKQPVEELFIIGVLSMKNGSELYAVMSDQSLHLLNIESVLLLEDKTTVFNFNSSIAGNHGTIADMRFIGPSLNKLALATNSPTLRIIPVPNENDTDHLPIDVDMYDGHEDLLNAVDSTEDGLWLATASKDNTAIVWRYNEDTEKFQQYAKYMGHSATVTAIGLPNVTLRHWPEFLLTASNDLTIKKWSIPKPKGPASIEDVVHEFKSSDYTRRAHDKDINALSISPNDSVFATASYDKTCKIWELETGELKATLANHKRGLWDVSFCQFDKILATCSGDKTIKIWSLDTFSVLKTLEGHTNAVQRCHFINKNHQLVSTGADGLVKIWDCSSGECLKTLDGHNNRIWALSVFDDGNLIVTADADGVFQFWRDCTEAQREIDIEMEKQKVEQEQSLQNYLANEDWTNAFLLAITLDHPMRLFNVLRRSLDYVSAADEDDKNIIFNRELDNVISTLNEDQLLLLMKRCRDWNTNARTHTIAQKTIRCILLHHNISDLSEIQGMMKIIDGIIPYTQRHFARVDNLVEQSYILDYALVQMDKLL